MIVLDSNLVIYSAQDGFAFLRTLIQDGETCLSAANLKR